MKILLNRQEYIIEVLLLPHKDGSGYSFVNVTKGHICPCVFKTIDDAMKDLQHYVQIGKVKNYYIL